MVLEVDNDKNRWKCDYPELYGYVVAVLLASFFMSDILFSRLGESNVDWAKAGFGKVSVQGV